MVGMSASAEVDTRRGLIEGLFLLLIPGQSKSARRVFLFCMLSSRITNDEAGVGGERAVAWTVCVRCLIRRAWLVFAQRAKCAKCAKFVSRIRAPPLHYPCYYHSL